jgi:hypothetical protein
MGFAEQMFQIKHICSKRNIYIVVVLYTLNMDKPIEHSIRLERVKRAKEILEEMQYESEG